MMSLVKSIINAAGETGEQNSSATTAPPSVGAPITVTPCWIQPEFLPFPGVGQVEPYSGLKRGQLYQLARLGHIQTVSLREPGRARGRRLVVLSSLKAHLWRLHAEQNPQQKGGAP